MIDGDLRRGSISAYVGSPKKGLSDYLGNRVANWNEALVIDKKHANLHVLPVGTIPRIRRNCWKMKNLQP